MLESPPPSGGDFCLPPQSYGFDPEDEIAYRRKAKPEAVMPQIKVRGDVDFSQE